MKVLQINSVYDFGSTGRIVAGIQNKCNEKDVFLVHIVAFINSCVV